MRRILFSPQARRELAEAWHYIAPDNVSAADHLVQRISQAVETLARLPGMGHQRDDVPDSKLFFWTVRPYVIAYRFTSRTLRIVRIVHGARDFRRIFS